MDWLLLAALGIIWAAFLIPTSSRRVHSPEVSVEEFGRNMDILADTERGRWVVTPKKGVAFIGTRARKRARVRERRRRVLVFLIEATCVSFLIGLVPPLRGIWLVSAGLGLLLGGYILLLLRLKDIESGGSHRGERTTYSHTRQAAAEVGDYGSGNRFVAEGDSRFARQSFAGLTMFTEGDDELVHVMVRGAEPVRF